jgi:hypothetical protein
MKLNDPQLTAAFRALEGSLRQAGYAADECAAIVEGAQERVADHLDAHPAARPAELVALVEAFHNPQLAPEALGDAKEDVRAARLAWVSLAGTLAGLVLFAPLVSALGGDGGAVMSLFALLVLPLTGQLAFFARHSVSGRRAGYAAAALLVLVALIFVAALLF